MKARMTSAQTSTLLTIASAALIVCFVTAARPVRAAFLGTNGQLTYGRLDPTIGDFQIFVANPDGSHEVRITDPNFGGEVSDWSPDGTRIAHDFYDGQNVQIATVNPDGSGYVQLTNDPNSFHGEPAWSPNGKVIAFDGTPGNAAAANGIYLMDSSTGAVLSRVTTNPYGFPDGEPRWSPDGQWISFTRLKTFAPAPRPFLHIRVMGAIFVVRPDGTGLTQVTSWGMLAASADWSPDGTKLVFCRGEVEIPPPAGSIWTVRPDGSGLIELVPAVYPTHFHHPKWSPDGTKVIFAGRLDPTQGENLWTVNADGSNMTKIDGISGPLGSLNFPSWGSHPLQ